MDNVETSETDEVSRLPAEAARQKVLEQHLELRMLLKIGLQRVRDWQAGKLDHSPLRTLVVRTREIFVRHLADEEGLILPILEDDLPWGPIRAQAIREEHTRQRSDLEELWAWPHDASEQELAIRFGGLAQALLEDIEHEERDVLTPDVIRDDCIVIDQTGG